MSTCPRCGMQSSSEIRRDKDGVATANYICPNEHLWLVRWNTEVPA